MIGYLLVPALIIGVGASQTAKVTENEWSNQTFSTFIKDNSTHLGNVTSSLAEDELIKIENELQNNQTLSGVTEDDERFQDHEDTLVANGCLYHLLFESSHLFCGAGFYESMQAVSSEDRCVMENIIGPYDTLTLCLEKLSGMLGCYYPNPDIQDFFLHIHSSFFQNCTKDELPIEDAPQWLVVALTLLPVSLIPVLVYVVVWKSKVQE